MRDALTLRGETSSGYPVKQNRTREPGVPYTGAVVHYEGDGIGDPHVICAPRDDHPTPRTGQKSLSCPLCEVGEGVGG